MPIYVYRCSHCGHAQDVLQKMSDPQLRTCPACGQDTYEKQVTAASFRLKGTGWYVTDFRDGKQAPAQAVDAAGDGAAHTGHGTHAADAAPAGSSAASASGASAPAAAGAAAGASAAPSSQGASSVASAPAATPG